MANYKHIELSLFMHSNIEHITCLVKICNATAYPFWIIQTATSN